MRKFLIALVVLVAVLAVADRISLFLAERKIANRVAATYRLASPPAVTIRGFPFLTQVVAGKYQQVQITVNWVQQSGVLLRDLRARFDQVHAPLSQLVSSGQTRSITANRADATALIPFATVQARLPSGIRLGPDSGRLRLSGTLGYQGVQVPVAAAVSLHVTANAIEITPRNLTVGGTLPVPPTLLGTRLAIALPVHDLPMNLHVTSVRVTANGFEVAASADDVAFESGG